MSAEDGMMSLVALSGGSGVLSTVVNSACTRQDAVHGWLSLAESNSALPVMPWRYEGWLNIR